jgi:hypothetical protein
MQTTSPQNSFLLDANGWIQGMELDNQPNRIQRETGQITASQPIWGGMMIEQTTPTIDQNNQGPDLQLATAQNAKFAFTVGSGANNAILVPGNDVAQILSGMTASYYPNGKWTRLPVQCSAAVVTAVEGQPAGSVALYWDFTTQMLVTSGTTAIPNVSVRGFNSNSLIVNYDSTTKALTWSVGTLALLEF